MSERSAYIANQLRLRGQRQCVDGYAVPFDSDLDIEAAEMIEALTPPPAGDTGEAVAVIRGEGSHNGGFEIIYVNGKRYKPNQIAAALAHPSDAALRGRVAELERLDREAATYVESVICMRTRFTGEPPYVGWKGLGLALTEELDELDRLRARAHTGGTDV